MHASSPLVIVIEGIDGAGKSSQCSLVASQLADQGLRVATPTSDPTRPLRRVYKDLIGQSVGFPDARTSLLLGLADYAYAQQLSTDELADVVLLDRYAYSACADAVALGMRLDQVLPLLRLFDPPDLALFVDVSPQMALARKGQVCSYAEAGGPDFVSPDRSLQQSFVTYQSAVRDGFLRLIETHQGRFGYDIVSGEQSLEQVTAALTAIVARTLDARVQAEAVGA